MRLTRNDLLMLGFLLERPMHGYEINQALKSDGVELWFEISTAAVYYSLNKLHRLGLIAEAHTRGASGDRTVYHVTEPGREQFFRDVQGLLDSREPIRTDYDLGISLLNRVPQDQAEPLLLRRIQFLREWIADLDQQQTKSDLHPLQHAIIQHSIASARLDIEWLTDIIERLHATLECDPSPVGLMTLQGDLQEFHLPDLVKLIASGRHSGTLTLNTGVVSRSMTFERGRPKCAASFLSGEPVLDERQVLADVYQVFGWHRGGYAFDQRACPREGCFMLDSTANALMLEGARRLDSWEIIQRIVPGPEALFESRDGALPHEDLVLLGEERRILSLLDGVRDITGVARVSGLTEFETCRSLYGLYLVDLVQPVDPDKRRLKRVFREFAELMCRSAIPYRITPDEAAACEAEVNRRCQDLPVSIRDSRIVDQTAAALNAGELAGIYRRFLRTQHTVLGERLGRETADELRKQVLSKISPDLCEVLEQYSLL